MKNWDEEPWTPFEIATPDPKCPPWAKSNAVFVNSIYQVSVWYQDHPTFGLVAHLSFKTHDRQPRHDWREMQRIKNELCGEECEAIEIYPSEARLVDTSNQYHLYVFKDFKIPLGFNERLVSEGDGTGEMHKSRQRPFRPEFKPRDALSSQDLNSMVTAINEAQGKKE